MWLFFLFVGIPLIEIGLFIQVGGLIGLWATLAIVVITAVIGTNLVRSQGAQALSDLRRSFGELNDPTEPLAHGAMILFSGALLLTPGFFTDTVGFLLLIPSVRRYLMREISKRVQVQSVVSGQAQWRSTAPHGRGQDDVIEGDFEETSPPQSGPSGWTRE